MDNVANQVLDIEYVVTDEDVSEVLALVTRLATEADLALRSRRRALIGLYSRARAFENAPSPDRTMAFRELQAATVNLLQAFGVPPMHSTGNASG